MKWGEVQPEPRRQTVLLVDDQPQFLSFAQILLNAHPCLRVVGFAENGEAALTIAAHLKPDAVIVDLLMPGMSGFEAARQLVAILPGVRVLMVSTVDDPHLQIAAREVGAVGFLNKKLLSGEVVASMIGAA